MDNEEKIRIAGEIAGFHKLVLEGMVTYLSRTTKDGKEFKKELDELYSSIVERGIDVLYNEASQHLGGKDFLQEVKDGFPNLLKRQASNKLVIAKRPKPFGPGAYVLAALDDKNKENHAEGTE